MGSARVAPTPRRNVRRGNAFLVMNIIVLSIEFISSLPEDSPAVCLRLLRFSHLKRSALHHAQNQRCKRVIVPAPPRGRSRGPPAHRNTARCGRCAYISSFSATAPTNCSGWRSKRLLQSGHAVELRSRPGSTPEASIGLPASRSRHLPTASKFSIAKPIGSMRAWQLAQAGLARCWIIASRIGKRLAGFAAFRLQRRNVRRRRRRRRCEQILQHPLAAQHRRRPGRVGGERQDASLAQQSAARAAGGKRDAPEIAALHVGNAVVLGQPLIDERVVGRQQFEHAAILAQDAVEEQLGFPLERRRAGSRRNRGTAARPAVLASMSRRYSHCAAKLVTSDSERGSASMRRTCCSQNRRIAQLPAAGRRPAIRRRECCSRERRKGARPVPDR